MFNNDQMSAAFWFCIGAGVMVASLAYDLGRMNSPGSGFVPLLAGLSVCLFSVTGFIQATRAKGKGEHWKSILKGVRWQKPLIAISGLVFYTLLLERIGFFLATTLLVGFLLRVIYPQRWMVVISGAVVTSLGMYVIFQLWLKTQLPMGIFQFL